MESQRSRKNRKDFKIGPSKPSSCTHVDGEESEKYFVKASTSSSIENVEEGKFLDPRTGEEIDLSSLNTESEYDEMKGRGRGWAFREELNQEVQRQLRMIRPLGMSNSMIESYFPNRGRVDPKTLETKNKLSQSKRKEMEKDEEAREKKQGGGREKVGKGTKREVEESKPGTYSEPKKAFITGRKPPCSRNVLVSTLLGKLKKDRDAAARIQ